MSDPQRWRDDARLFSCSTEVLFCSEYQTIDILIYLKHFDLCGCPTGHRPPFENPYFITCYVNKKKNDLEWLLHVSYFSDNMFLD